MAQYFFKIPFAFAGDTQVIPLDAQPNGEVSYSEGFGPDYQAPSDDPDVLYPERPVINQLYKALTEAMQIIQIHGFPDWITTAANAGSPYSYDQWAFCRHSGVVWYSLISANTSEPGTDSTKWAQWQQFTVPTGTIWEFDGTTLPAGWIWANGRTVGNAASGATGRANADTEALFTQIWNDFPQAIRTLQDSSGNTVSRGVSAPADFAANRRIPVADRRGITSIGRDNMGGASSANRITEAGCGIDGTILGALGGVQQWQLTIDQMPRHNHTYNTYHEDDDQIGATSGSSYLVKTQPTSFVGGDAPHPNVQPSAVTNFIIKL